MNDRDIAFAKQAGFDDADWDYRKGIATLIDLIRADEREACAKLCEGAPEPDGADLAKRIRARGNT